MGTGLGDPAGNQVAASFESLAERGFEKCSSFFLSRGANPPQGTTFCEPEFASRIAKGQFQFSV
jgi:hypothetical protein